MGNGVDLNFSYKKIKKKILFYLLEILDGKTT